MRYKVSWAIDFDGNDCIDELDAAKKALEIMRDPDSTAIVFRVVDTKKNKEYLIDLLDENVSEI